MREPLNEACGRIESKPARPPGLTRPQAALLERVSTDWSRMNIGCTNATLMALESRGLIETRIEKFVPMGFSTWQWRLKPTP